MKGNPWRNGNASDSSPEDREFESLRGHIFIRITLTLILPCFWRIHDHNTSEDDGALLWCRSKHICINFLCAMISRCWEMNRTTISTCSTLRTESKRGFKHTFESTLTCGNSRRSITISDSKAAEIKSEGLLRTRNVQGFGNSGWLVP